MFELHTNIYIKHPDNRIHEQLKNIFKTINDKPEPDYNKIEDELLKDSISISPEGNELASRLLTNLSGYYGEVSEGLVAESRANIAGYHSLHFVHDNIGTNVISAIHQFLASLVPGVDVRGCLTGDGDPWEIFYRLEDGMLVEHYYEPEHDEINENELPQVYQWWHDGLPPEIKVGFINDWLDREEV